MKPAYAILESIAERFAVSRDAIRSRTRLKHVTAARHAFWLELREQGWSFPAIALESRVHHTTVMDGCIKAKAARDLTPEDSAVEKMNMAGDLIIKAMDQMVNAGMRRDHIFKELSDLFKRARKNLR